MEPVLVFGAVLLAIAASFAARQAPVGPLRRRFMAAVAIVLLLGSYKSLGVWVPIFGSIIIVLAVLFVEKQPANDSSDEEPK